MSELALGPSPVRLAQQATATAAPAKPAAPAPSIHPGWWVAAVGGVSLIAGGVVYGLAAGRHGEIVSGQGGFEDRTALQEALAEVDRQQTLAMVLAGGGLLVAGGGATWALLSPPRIALTPRSVSVSFTWVLP